MPLRLALPSGSPLLFRYIPNHPTCLVLCLSLTVFQIIGIRVFLWMLSFIVDLEAVTWDDTLVDGLAFVGEYVLQVPLFLMSLMRYVTPTLDNLYVVRMLRVRIVTETMQIHGLTTMGRYDLRPEA